MTQVEISNVSYSYGKRQVLKDVTFAVPQCRVTMLLGPNGAGKTTLFSLIAGLLALQSGGIAADRNTLGVVFQQPALDLELTVAQNLNYYASLNGISRKLAASRIDELLGPLELATRRHDRVRDLNGGHRRRVEIARAMIAEPRLLLLDEPTSGLDIPTRKSLVAYLHAQAKARNMAVLWSTHLVDEVEADDHIVILTNGQVAADGGVEDVLRRAKCKTIAEAFTRFAGAEAA